MMTRIDPFEGPRRPLSHDALDLCEGAVALATRRFCAATTSLYRRQRLVGQVRAGSKRGRLHRLVQRRERARILRDVYRDDLGHYLALLHERTTPERYAEVLAAVHRRRAEAEIAALAN